MHKSSIYFFKESPRFRFEHSRALKKWIGKTITAHKKKPGDINIIFCSDAYLLGLNKNYLNHSTLTDILTFDNSGEKKIVSGDIFISVERVRENAKIYSTSFRDELHRVMIHGILHLLGFDDQSASAKSKMRKMEDRFLALRRL